MAGRFRRAWGSIFRSILGSMIYGRRAKTLTPRSERSRSSIATPSFASRLSRRWPQLDEQPIPLKSGNLVALDGKRRSHRRWSYHRLCRAARLRFLALPNPLPISAATTVAALAGGAFVVAV